jgi:hypothetical protein
VRFSISYALSRDARTSLYGNIETGCLTTALNESGLRLFKRVHMREVEKAKGDPGCNVPEKVLEEFPDLKDGN